MGNQQERLECEIAWLTALMEGEGWFSLGKTKTTRRGKPYFMYTLFCGVCNCDLLLIDECKRLFEKYNIMYNVIKRKGSGIQGYHCLDRYELVVKGINRVKPLLELVHPYMIGAKKFRVEIMKEYIKLRESKANHNTEYGDEEKAVYEKLFQWKGKRHSKILNDLTPGTLNSEDKV